MALTEKTQQEDERLREELKHADLEKFKKVIKSAVSPKKKTVKNTPSVLN